MTVTRQDLDSFHQFAADRLGISGSGITMDDLVIEWDSSRSRDEINAAISEGLADIEAGRHRPAGEVSEELRLKHIISE